ncbi:hypothetical protein L596_030152 [Steinernema carpocapsae]|uniref:Uncharacterized protein n=1 Tax=Steinernema carpocapsae TaxID=34508 RepID=A0A4U5LRW1_STECR|nr:hypothetical protein L596_030152 [Steinernema carpocapsae]
MRTNLGMAMVCMVNNTAFSAASTGVTLSNLSKAEDTCGVAEQGQGQSSDYKSPKQAQSSDPNFRKTMNSNPFFHDDRVEMMARSYGTPVCNRPSLEQPPTAPWSQFSQPVTSPTVLDLAL